MSAPYLLHAPAEQTAPVVFASAHSGRAYSDAFLASARLDALTLRRSEDSFVDELFGHAPAAGAPLLIATFPRAFCDVNRESWELDPAMFTDALPGWVNTRSPRVQAGLGMMARIVSSGEAIYRGKLPFAEAERRVRDFWQPWHASLDALIAQTKARFGTCLLIDCHSMPGRTDGARAPADVVLGDAHGTSCAADAADGVARLLQDSKFRVARNDPYAGGFITRHYGRPQHNVHALQVEVARDLYMDERRIEKGAGFERLRRDLAGLVDAIIREAPGWLDEKNGGVRRHRQV